MLQSSSFITNAFFLLIHHHKLHHIHIINIVRLAPFYGMQTGLGYCLQLSSGSHAVSSVFGISRENFIIAGVTAPLFAPTSVINGPVNFSVSVNNTRIKMKDVIIAGAVNIAGSATNQSLRHVFSNVEFQKKLSP